MEEAHGVLRDTLADGDEPDGLGSRVHARVIALTGGVNLAVSRRSARRTWEHHGPAGAEHRFRVGI